MLKKEIKISLFVLIGFLSFLRFEKPLREFLSEILFDELIAKQISGISIRMILIVIIFLLINKFQLLDFTGLNSWRNHKNIQTVFITLAFVIVGISGNWNTYVNTDLRILFLFALSTMAVGIAEELAFRGTILPLLIISFANRKQPILKSAILSSLMFGLVHFINLFSQPENSIGIISQVFFATAIGVFFCGLMVRTENILIPCILHALVNFSFGAGELKQTIEETSTINESSVINLDSLIPTTIFFLFIFIGGVYMILKTDEKTILEKLKIE
jgi:membrane protease YdiL (CAAX protease family)